MNRVRPTHKAITAELVAQFAQAAVLGHEAMQYGNTDEYNGLRAHMTAIEDELKSRGLADRRALLPLLDHVHPGVRHEAAAACMGFAPEYAIPVYEKLSEGPYWFEQACCSHGLQRYRSGEWRPD